MMDGNAISNEEKELAERLRGCCSPWGVERRSKLQESACILIGLGALYIQKARHSTGMKQKLTFIKCAALISGARVRFQKYLSDGAGVDRCKEAFKDMCSVLLVSSGAKMPNADLLEMSKKVASLLKQIRDKEKEFIRQKLAPIGDEVSKCELVIKQKARIELLKLLLKENSVYYKAIMRYISEECIKVLGDPPCKFCIVGLGSLAREEVTLYSDFEHVILLELGVSEEIKEYFRWYTILFQVIILALGETYIPTVGVESLNDLYCEDKARDWYFDLYTPGGVSFDGRFPHSCKSPLGKQEPSMKRKQVVELIQPVDKMLEYLTTEEDEKNGYHLRDILIRTCLVHGDKELYLDFKKRTSPIITRDTRDQEVLEQAEFVVKNVNSFLGGSSVNLDKIDFERIKDFFYRPVTVLVGCLSRVCRKATGTNLDFFPWFRQMLGEELASSVEEYLHDLEYAVAVACEIRLKVYAVAGQQKQKMAPSDVSKFIGKRCLVGCLRTVQKTSALFRAIWEEKAGFVKFFQILVSVARAGLTHGSSLIEASICKIFGYHDDALKAYIKSEADNESLPSHYFEAGLSRPDRRDEYFRKAEELFDRSGESQELTFEYVDTISQIYFYQGRYEHCLDLLEKWTKKHRGENRPVENHEYQKLQQMKASVLSHVMIPEEIVAYANKEMDSSSDTTSQIAFRLTKVIALLLLSDFQSAKQILSESSQLCLKRFNYLPQNYCVSLAEGIFRVQVVQAWKEDAAVTKELIDFLQGTKERNEPDPNFSLVNSSVLASEKPDDVTIALQYFENKLPKELSQVASRGNLLGLLLEQRGVSNFFEIAKHFESAPSEVLHHPSVHNNLHAALRKYYEKMTDARLDNIGRDLLKVFTIFNQNFENPRYIGTTREIGICIVTRYFSLKLETERRAAMYHSGQKYIVTYNVALREYGTLQVEKSAALFWKALQNEVIPKRLRDKSCQFLFDIIIMTPFVKLIDFLRQQRPSFVNRLSFHPSTTPKKLYNKAIGKLVELKIEFCAKCFWKIMFKSSRGSTLRKRAIEMLMFSILIRWEGDGYPMYVGNRYIYNRPVKLAVPVHIKFGDFYSMLSLSSEDIKAALEQAALRSMKRDAL